MILELRWRGSRKEYVKIRSLTANNCLEEKSEKQTHKAFKQIRHKSIISLAEGLTTSKIAKVLEILDDEQWHPLTEIQQKMKLNENQIRQIIKFLKEYNFVILNGANKEIRLEENVRRFLTQNTTS